MQWTAVLAGPQPIYDPAVADQYEGTGGGTWAAPTAFAKGAVP